MKVVDFVMKMDDLRVQLRWHSAGIFLREASICVFTAYIALIYGGRYKL